MAGNGDRSQPQERYPGANLGWSLAMVLRRWQDSVGQAVEGIPHGTRGYHLLSVVVHDDLPTQGAIASRLAMDRTVLTYLIDDLESAGLVERQLDKRDRRARRIVATDEGRRILADADKRVADSENQVLAGLTESERGRFRAAAVRAAEAIHVAAPDTDPCTVADVLEPSDAPHRP